MCGISYISKKLNYNIKAKIIFYIYKIFMNSLDIERPLLEENEPVYKYIRRLELYAIKLKENDYKLILNFINIWMESKKININKLMDFKNIYDYQLPNESINKEVMSKVEKN
jgi:hypothetical protein